MSSYTKVIFGLKVKQLRQQLGYSFAELSRLSGLSISYLNEIEKGKKYPKRDKIEALATALRSSAATMTSGELTKNLEPLSKLLKSNFLNELPLDLFGIEASKVIELIANAPARVGAFISAIMDISQSYSLQQESFYFAALRAYQALHNNYFEDIEDQVDVFCRESKLSDSPSVPLHRLYEILKKEYNYIIDDQSLANYPELKGLRSVFLPKKKTLLLHPQLKNEQRAYLLAKEIAYNFLKIKERNYTSAFLKVRSFTEVINDQQAGYFANALLMNRDRLVMDIHNIFRQTEWPENTFRKLLTKYDIAPEMLLERICNLLPKFFGIQKFFFLQFNTKPGSKDYKLHQELHLSQKHHPHGNSINEHYCRRWLTLRSLGAYEQQQAKGDNSPLLNVQRSFYFGTDDEYICLSFSGSSFPNPDEHYSVTIGILIDDKLRETLQFLDDPNILREEVNKTCERCPILSCEERAVPPKYIEAKALKMARQAVLDELMDDA